MDLDRMWAEEGRTYEKFQIDKTKEGWPIFCVINRWQDKSGRTIVSRRIQVDDFLDNHSSLELSKRGETDEIVAEAIDILREHRKAKGLMSNDEQRRQDLAAKHNVSIEDVIAAEQVFARAYGKPSEDKLALADEIKTKAVELLLLYYKVSPVHTRSDGNRARGSNVSHGIRQLEDSVMWVVKALLNSGD
jgi:hypothetical protein